MKMIAVISELLRALSKLNANPRWTIDMSCRQSMSNLPLRLALSFLMALLAAWQLTHIKHSFTDDASIVVMHLVCNAFLCSSCNCGSSMCVHD